MKIAVLGSTGMAGSAIAQEAAVRSHEVLAISRRPKATGTPLIRPHALDIGETESLAEVLKPVDACVCAVRTGQGMESQVVDLTLSLLDAAQQSNTRVLIIGGSAPLWSPNLRNTRVVDDPQFVPSEWQAIARASLQQFETCLSHSYTNWTYLSPPALFMDGERTGTYERGTDTLLLDATGTSSITASDLAIAAIDEVEDPRNDQHFTVMTPTR